MWRNPPTGFQANPVCFDQNCTTNTKNNTGYITAGMSAIGCELNIQICEQYINVGPDSNYNVLNQVQQQQKCSQIIQNSSTSSTSSSSQSSSSSSSSGGGGSTSSNTILFVIIGIVIVLLIAGGGVYYWYNYIRPKNMQRPHQPQGIPRPYLQQRPPLMARPRQPLTDRPYLQQRPHLIPRPYPPQQVIPRSRQAMTDRPYIQQRPHLIPREQPLTDRPEQVVPRRFNLGKPDYLQTRPQQRPLAIPNRFTQ